MLSEELYFTRASHRLFITQPALSKQIKEIEELNRVHLFARGRGQTVELTQVGRAFVDEARIALLHVERALQFAREVDCNLGQTLRIGYSPGTNRSWISTLLAIRLCPPNPKIKIRLSTRFALDLVRDLIVGDLK